MPKLLLLILFIVGCVCWTALLAAAGSGWRAGVTAFKAYGAWMLGLALFGALTWLCA
jgi:hypothetical protein